MVMGSVLWLDVLEAVVEGVLGEQAANRRRTVAKVASLENQWSGEWLWLWVTVMASLGPEEWKQGMCCQAVVNVNGFRPRVCVVRPDGGDGLWPEVVAQARPASPPARRR